MGRHSTTGRYSIDKFLEIYNDEILKYKIQNIRNGNSERFEVRQKSLIGRNIHESSKDFLDKMEKLGFSRDEITDMMYKDTVKAEGENR